MLESLIVVMALSAVSLDVQAAENREHYLARLALHVENSRNFSMSDYQTAKTRLNSLSAEDARAFLSAQRQNSTPMISGTPMMRIEQTAPLMAPPRPYRNFYDFYPRYPRTPIYPFQHKVYPYHLNTPYYPNYYICPRW